ncbi:MAG TPA: hypothetical protein EYN66_18405 [Myxococcales bacterium]|nr:hypothetical protein [Myxococcales bacterium]
MGAAAQAEPQLPVSTDALNPESENATPQANNNVNPGVLSLRIDASSKENWVYFDFEQGRLVDVAAKQKWDLAFQRYHVKMNQLDAAHNSMGVAILADTEFDSISQLPSAALLRDEYSADPKVSDPSTYAFDQAGGWYTYNPMKHQLSPNQHTYIVRSLEGTHYKMQFLNYYDDAGTSGHVTIRWALLPAAAVPVDATQQ